MLMPSTAALSAPIPSVSGVTTPTLHPSTAAMAAASVAEAVSHNQKDTTYTKIFVGGLPYHTSDKSLREHFEVFGEIEEAVVITDRQTGKSKGYGFVTMVDRSGAERAIKDPSPVIDGRKANVNLAYLGAKPRGNAASSFPTALTHAAAMRMYPQLSPAGSQYSLPPPANYVYQIPYSTQGQFPIISAGQLPHLTSPVAMAAATASAAYPTSDYTSASYPASATGYTSAQPALEHYGLTIPHGSQALTSYHQYVTQAMAAAAGAGGTFSLGGYQSPAAPPQSALQEARMQ